MQMLLILSSDEVVNRHKFRVDPEGVRGWTIILSQYEMHAPKYGPLLYRIRYDIYNYKETKVISSTGQLRLATVTEFTGYHCCSCLRSENKVG